MSMIDLRPAAERMASLVRSVDEASLERPTPCPDYDVAGLLGHVGGFAKAFTAAANKDLGPMTSQPPGDTGGRLPPGWRNEMTRDLAALGEAWQSAEAWTGMSQ